MVVECDLGFDVELDTLHAVYAFFFFNLATHMQAHARECYDSFTESLMRYSLNVASKFACFFLSLQMQNSYAHIYKHVQLV